MARSCGRPWRCSSTARRSGKASRSASSMRAAASRRPSPSSRATGPERAAGQQEQPARVLAQQVERDGRPAGRIVAQEAVRGEPLQVVEPRRIHRQRDQRVGVLPRGVGAVGSASARARKSWQPMIGWMPFFAQAFGEFQRAEHVGAVGQRHRRHAVADARQRRPACPP